MHEKSKRASKNRVKKELPAKVLKNKLHGSAPHSTFAQAIMMREKTEEEIAGFIRVG
jgi:hypothetical protein